MSDRAAQDRLARPLPTGSHLRCPQVDAKGANTSRAPQWAVGSMLAIIKRLEEWESNAN